MANIKKPGAPLDRLRLKYGETFPDPKTGTAEEWQAWFRTRRDMEETQARTRKLHWSRHRNFRVGNQWIASRDGRTWKEPGADKNSLRPVDNQIGPALDFRHGVIAEQKPGFRHDLNSASIKAREKAEAQQAVAEHYFHKLNAWKAYRDAVYHAQTDGCCFIQVWYDPNAGSYVENVAMVKPDDSRAKGLLAQGYQQDGATGAIMIPLSDSGKELPANSEVGQIAEGDLAHRVVLAHDTMVDPEARCLNGDGADAAKWFLVRRPRDLYGARIETDNPELKAEVFDAELDPTDFPQDTVANFSRGLPPFPAGGRVRFKESVYDYTIYIAPNGEDLPKGMWRRVIGDTLVDGGDELPGGIIPFARFTDGSTDPSFYPRPVVSDWIGDQITINAIQALIMQHGRILGIGRLLAMKGTMLTETYNNIIGSVLEYEGMKPERMDAQSASVDLWKLLEFKIKKLEDKTGFNDLARGQVLGQSGGGMQDVSGRAVLGAREMLERTFGPMVQATAEGASEWANIVVRYAAWMFGDTPRQIENTGGRGDLGKLISKEEIQGDCSVYTDPATLMPMPAQLRQQQLDDFLDKGRISLATWSQRSPYAETRNVHMGDLDHFQRAEWVNSMIEENYEEYAVMLPQELFLPETGVPIFWQDDPATHLRVLNEIILDERKPWDMRKVAGDRSTVYEQLAQAKADPMQPVPLEVLLVPLNRMRAEAMAMLPSAGGTGPVGPDGQPSMNPAPGGGDAVVPQGTMALPPVVPPTGTDNPAAGMTDHAQPLGSVGADEQGMRS